MFKKINFKGLNYGDLDRLSPHDLKRDELHSFYQTFDFFELIKKWPEIVGPKMSAVSSPLKLKNGSLFVITKHASFSHDLSYLAEEIKVQAFKFFPKLRPVVKKLVFQTQESFFVQRTPEKEQLIVQNSRLHPQSPQYKFLKQEAEILFKDVEDEELRKIMISIYIQSS